MGQLTGEVAWFNNAKGFGFLKHDGGPDVFVHHTAIVADGYRTLKEGDKVTFEIVDGAKGPQAGAVTVLQADKSQSTQAPPSYSGSANASAYA